MNEQIAVVGDLNFLAHQLDFVIAVVPCIFQALYELAERDNSFAKSSRYAAGKLSEDHPAENQTS